jgi:hypothetical protein
MRGLCVTVSVTGVLIMASDFLRQTKRHDQIGVEFLGAKFGGGDGEADIFLPDYLAHQRTDRTDFDALSQSHVATLQRIFSG